MEIHNLDTIDYNWCKETYKTIDVSTSIHQAITTAQQLILKTQNTVKVLFNKVRHTVLTTPLEPLVNNINTVGTDIEKGFNIAGCTPFICILSGPLRAIAGKIQILVGGIIATIGEIGLFLSIKATDDAELLKKWQTLSKLGTEHIIHGCLNVLRGMAESLISGSTMGIGNIFLLIPNLSDQRNFAPYVSYGTLLLNLHKKNTMPLSAAPSTNFQ